MKLTAVVGLTRLVAGYAYWVLGGTDSTSTACCCQSGVSPFNFGVVEWWLGGLPTISEQIVPGTPQRMRGHFFTNSTQIFCFFPLSNLPRYGREDHSSSFCHRC
ncbi:hypothetical protein K470DRAFT_160887 [Piedraia hortae CBS 480.64]|uniref:Secreted protein n=1 Tax=Piedraia hortae CBS 480.64 TaxID=1314780 RepID=A0A6A7BT43_9PEZI|nr:hypothetical protein K470DRAFT_160887 [Piedraia hortae CBS 480.64]